MRSLAVAALLAFRKFLASGDLYCNNCRFGVCPDVCLICQICPRGRCTVNTQKAIDTDLKRGSSFLLNFFISVCSTPGSSNPVPAAGDRRGNESYFGGGGSCTSRLFNLKFPWTAIEGCTIRYKNVPNQNPRVDVSRSVHAFQL